MHMKYDWLYELLNYNIEKLRVCVDQDPNIILRTDYSWRRRSSY
jgi:hypothetical protein